MTQTPTKPEEPKAATLAEKVVKNAPDHQVDDSEKARLAEEASRQSDA
ncbi:MAG: hypothetical protein J0I28_02650 [Caulobacterales bacterium]|nr:hypothetical protein [Caulobacterales bacterium]